MSYKYGKVIYDGVEYVLLGEAWICEMADQYTAYAVRICDYVPGAKIDYYVDEQYNSDLPLQLYRVFWCIVQHDCDDESNACDWDNPAFVTAL